MKKAAICALLAAAFFTGCSASGSVENLLSPPIMFDLQEEIYYALEKSVGKEIELVYPRSGAYRSPIILEDIDGDGDSEAVVLYRKKDETRINILDTDENGSWMSAADAEGGGTGVDRVLISSLGDAQRISVIVGFNSVGSDSSMKIFTYGQNGLEETAAAYGYGSMFLYDLNNDGNNELYILNSNNEYIGRKASLTSVSDTGIKIAESASVSLNSGSSEFINISLGNVGENTPAIYIDELCSGQLYTEIIYDVGGTLRNPLYLDERESILNTVRSRGYLSTDIDLDGIIEIPTLSYFPGYSQDNRDSFFVTNWNVYQNFTITKKYASYYDLDRNFCFIIPSRWDGLVTVKHDEHNGDIVFYRYFSDILNSTEELMRISAVTKEYNEEKLTEGYVLLKTRDNLSFFYKLPEDSESSLVLTTTEIVNNFYLMI